MREKESERERANTQAGEGQREREGTQNPRQAPGSRLQGVHTEPDMGLGTSNPEILT